MAVNQSLPKEARALLDTIAGTESPDYRTVYGGKKFIGYDDHPRIAVPIGRGPNKGRTSSAAGRYQFLGSTWDAMAKKHGLRDFSPPNQDIAAWELAKQDYGRRTGGNLLKDLRAGKTSKIGKALSPTWTSLPSGIETAGGTDKFNRAYSKFMGAKAPRPAQQQAGPSLLEGWRAQRQQARPGQQAPEQVKAPTLLEGWKAKRQAAQPKAQVAQPQAQPAPGQVAPPSAAGGFQQNPYADRPDVYTAPTRDAGVDFGAGLKRGVTDVGMGLAGMNKLMSQSPLNPAGLLQKGIDLFTGGKASQVQETGMQSLEDWNKQGLEQYQREYGESGAAGAGRFTGNVLPMMIPGAQGPRVAGVVPNVMKGAGLGAAQNVAIGSGRDPNADLGDLALTGAGFGAAGSMVGQMLPKAWKGMTGGIKATGQEGGQQAVKSSGVETLLRFGGGHPERLQGRLRDAPTLVPGAAPTTAQAAMLPGISQLQRGLTAKGAAGGAGTMLDREAMQDVARLNALRNVADTQGMTAADAAQAAGQQIGGQVRGAHSASRAATSEAYKELSEQAGLIATDPGKAQAILSKVWRQQKPSSDIKEITDVLEGNPALSFDDLQSLREDVADLAWRATTGNVKQGSKVKRAATELKQHIDDLINVHSETAFTAAKQARIQQGKLYERGFPGDITRVKPSGEYGIDEAQIMQRLLSPGGKQAATGRQFSAVADDASRESAKKAAMAELTERSVRGVEGSERLLPGSMGSYIDKRSQVLKEILSPDELAAVQTVRQDALRAAESETLGKGVGSDTAQKLFSMGLLDTPIVQGVMSKTPVIGGMAQGATAAMREAGERQVTEEVAKLMADPKLAAEAIEQFIKLQRQSARMGTGGGLLAVPGSQGLLSD